MTIQPVAILVQAYIKLIVYIAFNLQLPKNIKKTSNVHLINRVSVKERNETEIHISNIGQTETPTQAYTMYSRSAFIFGVTSYYTEE